MKITQIEKQKNNPRRFNIFLDGQFAFGADEDLVVDQRLVINKEITKDQLTELLAEAEIGKLVGKVYKLLERRLRSEKEIREYFKIKNYKLKMKDKEEAVSGLVIDELIIKLKEKGLIDDFKFANSWVESRSRKKGALLLRQELYNKGIGKNIIEEVLNENSKLDKEEKIASELLIRKIKQWKTLERKEYFRKAIQFLMRRGFSYGITKQVIEKINREDYN